MEWAKHTDKIGDPLKTAIESINTNVNAAFGSLIVTDDPAEDTLMIAAEEFATAVERRSQLVNTARLARDIEFSDNAVVGMEEFA